MTVTNGRQRLPALPGFFTWPSDAPALIASRCLGCGTYSFPAQATCNNPACRDKRVEKTTLSRRGRLWTYTVHQYKPPPPFISPEPFEPYAVGMVELPEGIKVMGMLTDCAPETLRIGTPMELVIDRLGDDEAGNELLTWKFARTREPANA